MASQTSVTSPFTAANSTDCAVFRTHLALPRRREGKVRDVYATALTPDAPLLIVATDRLSAFDVVMPTPIANKGRVLTEMSLGWFAFLRAHAAEFGVQIRDHVIGTDLSGVSGLTAADRALLTGRSMLVRAAKVVPIECVARGYLAGSGWNEYRATSSVCGVKLPAGLQQSSRLPAPIFSPATKEESGHDQNISFERASELVGSALMTRLRETTLALYQAASAYALTRGVILADTKFEFGFALDSAGNPTDELMLIDEVLTPDSSRYWPAAEYEAGREQASYDKQFVRNYLLELVAAQQWNKEAPGPELPAAVIAATLERYREALERLALPHFDGSATFGASR